MKKTSRILTIILTAMMLFSIGTTVLAASGAVNPKTGIKSQEVDVSGITTLGGKLITVISTIGSIAAVLVLIVLGLKYMMGSAEEKAEYKKTLVPYIIGAGLVFAASTIAGAIYGFMNSVNGG